MCHLQLANSYNRPTSLTVLQGGTRRNASHATSVERASVPAVAHRLPIPIPGRKWRVTHLRSLVRVVQRRMPSIMEPTLVRLGPQTRPRFAVENWRVFVGQFIRR